MNPRWADVARRANYRCEYCRAPERIYNFFFEVEHVEPTSRGGADEDANLCLACRACHGRKGNRVAARDEVTGQTVPLYNPRAQRWSEHFTVDLETFEIHGATPTGRATVSCLDLNHPAQLIARHLWAEARVFP